MPIKFVSLNEKFNEKIAKYGFESYTMNITKYVPKEGIRTYYVSPANSLCFMDGGFDYALSRNVFPNIEHEVKQKVRELNIRNILQRYYLPIGSSIIIDKNNLSLIVAPTMLLPQDVSQTENAYYATMAILHNILVNRNENIDNIDLIFTSLCCGYGKMSEDESIRQILGGIKNYRTYSPKIHDTNTIINEPNLHVQPKYYQNTEWFSIKSFQIKQIS
jgi:O-acetyl-ADP-ribose deacetylase (regulator of RNase III)